MVASISPIRLLEKAILPFCARESASAMFVVSAKVSKQIANIAAVVTNNIFRRLALLNPTLYNTPPSSLRRPRPPHARPERNYGSIHIWDRPCITQTMPLPTAAFGIRPSMRDEGCEEYHAVEESGECRSQSAMLRFIVGVLWLVLIGFMILVFLNMPGIR
jgi:hypothetical protein